MRSIIIHKKKNYAVSPLQLAKDIGIELDSESYQPVALLLEDLRKLLEGAA